MTSKILFREWKGAEKGGRDSRRCVPNAGRERQRLCGRFGAPSTRSNGANGWMSPPQPLTPKNIHADSAHTPQNG